MKNLRLALLGASALLLAVGGMSVVACGNDDSTGFPTVKDAGQDSSVGDDDDDASVTHDSGAPTDAATPTDSSTAKDGSSSSFADIYGCGTPHDCTGGQTCVITAYSDWDGGDFLSPSKACTLIAATGTECKATPIASDVIVCADIYDAGGATTACPTGTTCQAVQVYSKNIGACLPTGSDAGCKSTVYVPYSDSANYCFAANKDAGGCSGSNVVCCDLNVSGTFEASCVASVSACNLP